MVKGARRDNLSSENVTNQLRSKCFSTVNLILRTLKPKHFENQICLNIHTDKQQYNLFWFINGEISLMYLSKFCRNEEKNLNCCMNK